MRECTKIIPRLFLFNNIIAKLLYPKYSNASTMTKLEVTFANPLTEIVVALGTSMYYVKTKKGGGSRKWQFLITFSTESNHKGEERGGGFRKPQILLRNTWMVPYLEPFSMLGLSLHNEAFTVFEQSRTTNA